MNQMQLLLLTLGSEQSMLNHRTEAQALCCWLEFEITTPGREEVWDGKREYGHKNWTAKSMECLNITEDVLNEETMFHLQRDRQALIVKLGLKGYSVHFFSHTQWELHKTQNRIYKHTVQLWILIIFITTSHNYFFILWNYLSKYRQHCNSMCFIRSDSYCAFTLIWSVCFITWHVLSISLVRLGIFRKLQSDPYQNKLAWDRLNEMVLAQIKKKLWSGSLVVRKQSNSTDQQT